MHFQFFSFHFRQYQFCLPSFLSMFGRRAKNTNTTWVSPFCLGSNQNPDILDPYQSVKSNTLEGRIRIILALVNQSIHCISFIKSTLNFLMDWNAIISNLLFCCKMSSGRRQNKPFLVVVGNEIKKRHQDAVRRAKKTSKK